MPERGIPPTAVRSVERALEPRHTLYVDEVRRLIWAGLQVILECGTEEPRVADIVRRAGLSNKAFYRHFRSKDELMRAVLEWALGRGMARFEEQLERPGSPEERIRTWIWLVLEQALDPALSASTRPLLVFQARIVESANDAFLDSVRRMKESLRAALEAAAAGGELPGVDPVRDADAIYHLATGWMYQQVLQCTLPPREEAEAVLEFAMRGLKRAPAA